MLNGWATRKDGEPYDLTFHRTRKSILIGYDMMPLMGLERMAKSLASNGIDIVRCRLAESTVESRHAYCVEVMGKLEPYSMEWSIVHTGGGVWKVEDHRGQVDLCWWSTEFYLQSNCNKLTEDEKTALGYFHWHDRDYSDPNQPRDKRTRKTFEARKADVAKVFERLGVRLVPVRFEWIDK